LDKKNPMLTEQARNVIEHPSTNEQPSTKKLFVEPEVSVPVDVLEATTFFQVASSGATN
jgi:hypothetical protein